MNFIIIFIGLFLTELAYMKIARYFSIVDVPNVRSAHSKTTLLGIGIIIPLSAGYYFFFYDLQFPFFFIGLLIIGGISFLDDVLNLPSFLRLIFHFVAIVFLEYQVFELNIYLFYYVFYLILGVGFVNASNFMDGINGLSGAYGLLCLIFLYIINQNYIFYIESSFFIIIGMAIVIFLVFNFRSKALGFGGDVGSISLAYILLFLLYLIISLSNNWKFIFLFWMYGMDTIYTLILRIQRKENLFTAHKLHFYQLLVHKYRIGHIKVTMIYLLMQFILNIWILKFELSSLTFFVPFLLILFVMHLSRKESRIIIIK